MSFVLKVDMMGARDDSKQSSEEELRAKDAIEESSMHSAGPQQLEKQPIETDRPSPKITGSHVREKISRSAFKESFALMIQKHVRPTSPGRETVGDRKSSIIKRAARSFRRLKDARDKSVSRFASSDELSDESKSGTRPPSDQNSIGNDYHEEEVTFEKEEENHSFVTSSNSSEVLAKESCEKTVTGSVLGGVCDIMSLSSNSMVEIWEREDSMSTDDSRKPPELPVGIQGISVTIPLLDIGTEVTTPVSLLSPAEDFIKPDGLEGLLGRNSCDDVIEQLGLGAKGRDVIEALREQQAVAKSYSYKRPPNRWSIPKMNVMGISIPNYDWYVHQSLLAFQRDVLKISDTKVESVTKPQ